MEKSEASKASECNPLIERLAPRELECLRGVAAHKRTAQIAYELKLQPKTVDTYIANAFRKLGVADRDSAARMLLDYEKRTWGNSPSESSGVEVQTAARSSWLLRLPWPIPTPRRPTNDLTFPQLLIAITLAAGFMMAVAAIYLLSIALLSQQI